MGTWDAIPMCWGQGWGYKGLRQDVALGGVGVDVGGMGGQARDVIYCAFSESFCCTWL